MKERRKRRNGTRYNPAGSFEKKAIKPEMVHTAQSSRLLDFFYLDGCGWQRVLQSAYINVTW